MSDTFTLGTAILVAGYFLFPMLALVAAGLLLIALMLLAGAAIERGEWLGRPSPSERTNRNEQHGDD